MKKRQDGVDAYVAILWLRKQFRKYAPQVHNDLDIRYTHDVNYAAWQELHTYKTAQYYTVYYGRRPTFSVGHSIALFIIRTGKNRL